MSDTIISSTPTVTPPGNKPLLRRRWVKVTGAITGGSLIAIVAFAVGHGGGTPAAATTPAKPAAPPRSPAPAKPQTLLQAKFRHVGTQPNLAHPTASRKRRVEEGLR